MIDTVYNVAEYFHSIQGEGEYAGTPMFFIRLAGCNVGKYESVLSVQSPLQASPLQVLREQNPSHSVCTTVDGQRFLCDTDYHGTEKLSAEGILALETLKFHHICITGGEPFIHDLSSLRALALKMKYETHIETSGTLPIHSGAQTAKIADYPWITCSPKEGFRRELLTTEDVNEWKFLVDDSFNENFVREFQACDENFRPIFIQPVGEVHTHLERNITKCMDIFKRNPGWRLSAQLHKFIKER